MKKTSSEKHAFLLEAPLEVLHAESLEWLEEIEFWKDESAFFYTLVIEKTKQNLETFKTKESKDIEKHLVYISAEKLDDLRIEVQAHEQFLARLIGNIKLDDQLYRRRHKAIAEKIHSFESEFKEMKKKVFLSAKQAVVKKKSISV
ncbi:MAG: hypothetical protein HY840_14200 [Bacteroidetes bacterium]|nr:hypothetical protein [Bacteroidota bacterium]